MFFKKLYGSWINFPAALNSNIYSNITIVITSSKHDKNFIYDYMNLVIDTLFTTFLKNDSGR